MNKPRKRMNKQRRVMLIKYGQSLKRQGLIVGRKLIATEKLANVDTHNVIMRGMGYAVRRADPRRLHHK